MFRFEIQPLSTDDPVALSDGTLLPNRFIARRDPVPGHRFFLELELAVEGPSAVCEAVTIRREGEGGPPVDTGSLRVPLKTLIAQALGDAGYLIALTQHAEPAVDADGVVRGIRINTSNAEAAESDARLAGLHRVANIYRAHEHIPGPQGRPRPRQAVADALDLTENQARELIRAARREGLL